MDCVGNNERFSTRISKSCLFYVCYRLAVSVSLYIFSVLLSASPLSADAVNLYTGSNFCAIFL